MTNSFFEDVKLAIVNRLLTEGWMTMDHLPSLSVSKHAVVEKKFDTFLGEKTATIYLEPSLDKDGFIVACYYESEGRNILESLVFKITPKVSYDDIMLGIVTLSANIVEMIENSYAMKIKI